MRENEIGSIQIVLKNMAIYLTESYVRYRAFSITCDKVDWKNGIVTKLTKLQDNHIGITSLNAPSCCYSMMSFIGDDNREVAMTFSFTHTNTHLENLEMLIVTMRRTQASHSS